MMLPGVQAVYTGTKFIGDLGSNPLGHWKLDDLGSTAINSGSAGDDYDGVIYGGAAPGQGKIDYSISFDGTNDYIQVPDGRHAFDFGNGDDFSVFCWINADENNCPILNKYAGARGFNMAINSNDRLRVDLYIGLTTTTVIGASDIFDGLWHHIGFVRDGNTLEAWVDGMCEDTETNANGNVGSTGDLLFGKVGLSLYDGNIDDVRIYERAVEPTATMISHWDMEYDSTYPQKVFDIMSSNNGVLGTTDKDEQYDPTWDSTVVKVGSWSLNFDETNHQLVTVRDPSDGSLDFDLGVDFSIFCWIKTDDTFGRTIVHKYDGYGGYEMSISHGGDGCLLLTLWGVSVDVSATGTSDITNNVWHHVGLVRNGDTLEAWVDGVREGTSTDADMDVSNDAPLKIGADNGYHYWAGNIDDLRIFREAVVPAA